MFYRFSENSKFEMNDIKIITDCNISLSKLEIKSMIESNKRKGDFVSKILFSTYNVWKFRERKKFAPSGKSIVKRWKLCESQNAVFLYIFICFRH